MTKTKNDKIFCKEEKEKELKVALRPVHLKAEKNAQHFGPLSS